jgi:hypothetical protein
LTDSFEPSSHSQGWTLPGVCTVRLFRAPPASVRPPCAEGGTDVGNPTLSAGMGRYLVASAGRAAPEDGLLAVDPLWAGPRFREGLLPVDEPRHAERIGKMGINRSS